MLVISHDLPTPLMNTFPALQAVITASSLGIPHESGFYRRTFQAQRRAMVETVGGRHGLMTSVYYLLMKGSPMVIFL
jgi:predicted cupin superfamily sugar epimerase